MITSSAKSRNESFQPRSPIEESDELEIAMRHFAETGVWSLENLMGKATGSGFPKIYLKYFAALKNNPSFDINSFREGPDVRVVDSAVYGRKF